MQTLSEARSFDLMARASDCRKRVCRINIWPFCSQYSTQCSVFALHSPVSSKKDFTVACTGTPRWLDSVLHSLDECRTNSPSVPCCNYYDHSTRLN